MPDLSSASNLTRVDTRALGSLHDALHPSSRLRPEPQSEYFAEPQAKSGIALHHTVGDGARTTLDSWRRDGTPGGTPALCGGADHARAATA